MGGRDAHAVPPVHDLILVTCNFEAFAIFLVSHNGDISQALLACAKVEQCLTEVLPD